LIQGGKPAGPSGPERFLVVLGNPVCEVELGDDPVEHVLALQHFDLRLKVGFRCRAAGCRVLILQVLEVFVKVIDFQRSTGAIEGSLK
jgi:hypothetical protein